MYSEKKRTILYLFITILICSSCSNQSKLVSNRPKEEKNEQSFQMVTIPASIKDTKERDNYYVQHYWDSYNFRDTSYIHKPEILEQAFVDYLNALPYADKTVVDASIVQTLKDAEQDNRKLTYFLKLFNTYLYSPVSAQKNEEYYIVVLETMLKSDSVDRLDKVKAQFDLNILLKNRLGEPASDIMYSLISGDKSSLYELDKEYTLLMFYDPDCHACSLTTDYMKASPTLQKALETGLVDILLVYPGENRERWIEYSSNIPTEWINGFDKDQNIYRRRLYDLKALPTIYLLDKYKKIALKDVNVKDVEAYLVNNKPSIFNTMQ